MRYDWQAGDVAIVHNNCVHQHFNASPDKPARALVIKTKPMFMFMNMLFQQLVEPRPTTPAPGAENFKVGNRRNSNGWDESRAWRKGRNNQKLYQALLDDASAAPARNAKRKKIVRPKTCRGRCRARGCSSTSSTRA